MLIGDSRLCILAAGRGERTAHEGLPKALLRVGGRAVISRILDRFDARIEIVVAIGHEGQLVRRYLELAHPERHFFFVEVSRVSGPGSGPGASLFACRELLDRPFWLTTCDTLVANDPEDCDHNWVGVADHPVLERYDTVSIDARGRVFRWDRRINRDGNLAFIGLAGICHHQAFFRSLATRPGRPGAEHDLVGGFEGLIDHGLRASRFEWFDTGNANDLALTREHHPDEIVVLDKSDESIWFEGSQVVRWFRNEKIAANRVLRASDLKGLVPEIAGASSGFYRYRFVPGPLLSEVQTPALLENFYGWAKSHLWEDRRGRVGATEFVECCRRFYRDKTFDRLTRYFESRDRRDAAAVVNGLSLPPVFDLLESLDWRWICAGDPVRFHGDLHTDNVVVTGRDGAESFRLIDWRQDFAGRTDVGDLYYDLAKLHHYSTLSPRVVEQQRFDCRVDGNTVHHRHDDLPELGDCLAALERFVEREGWDLRKVEVLSALCFLNMGALHPGAVGDLFFHYGWSSLARITLLKKPAAWLNGPVVCEPEYEPITIR